MTPPTISVGAVQASLSDDAEINIARMTELVREAAGRGARIILMPELFEGHYFCIAQIEGNFDRAHPADEHPTIAHFQKLAHELDVVLPVSFFERSGPHYYNSIAIIDAGGALLGVYRKTHIPDGPGYQEKFYFRPGSVAPTAWATRHGRIGVAICWDQWFPESARAMALAGADVLFYPTAIGSEPHEPEFDTKDLWQRAMVGHAVCNVVGVVAANRTGTESDVTFYGSSFISDQNGDKLAELGRADEGVVMAELDVDKLRLQRASMGFFRDRRPDLYGPLVK